MKRYARAAGLLILLGLTLYGACQFFSGNWTNWIHFWKDKAWALWAVVLLGALDVALEGVAWIWIYERFDIRALDPRGGWAFLSGRAGLLLPAQLNRLIRPDAMARMGRGRMADCLKAEAAVFLLDCASVLALLVGLTAYLVHPLLGPLAALGVIGICLLLGNGAASMLSGTRMALPPVFWWKWQTLGIVLVEMAGWLAHGLAFYLIIFDLGPGIALWEPLLYAPASSVLGAGTGLPGGIGATEGLLGMSLKMMEVPQAHFLLAVGAFRLVTFWIWIPIGWVALVTVRKGQTPGVGPEANPSRTCYVIKPVSQTIPDAPGANLQAEES